MIYHLNGTFFRVKGNNINNYARVTDYTRTVPGKLRWLVTLLMIIKMLGKNYI